MEEKLIIFVLQRSGLRDFILQGYKNTGMTEQFMKADKQRVRYTYLLCFPKKQTYK
jgi:hypothetical protein